MLQIVSTIARYFGRGGVHDGAGNRRNHTKYRNYRIGAFDGLPNEIVCLILENVDFYDINSVTTTCKRFLLMAHLYVPLVVQRTFGSTPHSLYKGLRDQIVATKNVSKSVQWFKMAGCDLDYNKEIAGSLIFHAVSNGNHACVKALIDNGASIHTKTSRNGVHPLHVACAMGDEVMVKLLLDNGVNVDVGTSRDDMTSLTIAMLGSHMGIVHLLLAHGANVNHKSAICGSSLLHTAVKQGTAQVVEVLLEAGADINSENTIRRTPLHIAVGAGNDSIVALLIKRGVNVNCGGQEGEFFTLQDGASTRQVRMPLTPAILATNKGFKQISRMLAAANAA